MAFFKSPAVFFVLLAVLFLALTPAAVRAGSCASCAPCPAGQAGRSSSCSNCPSGCKNCVMCAAGTHTTSGECPSACYPCPVGHYSSTPTSSCSPCKANTYASHTGSVACTPCPAHSSTPTALGASTCVCNPGYVSNGQTGDGLVCTEALCTLKVGNKRFDLSSANDGSDAVVQLDTIGGSLAYINACKPLASNTTCPIGTRVCQKSASEFKVMATNIAAWQYDEADATLTVTYDGGEACPDGSFNKVVVHYTCGTVDDSSPSFVSEDPVCIYNFKWNSPAGCPSGDVVEAAPAL